MRFAPALGFAREAYQEDRFRPRRAAPERNFTVPGRFEAGVMLTAAIVFGAVGVAAGFTWDYVINRGK